MPGRSLLLDLISCRETISVDMRTPHTSTNKGKRVLCLLRNGTRFVDKFLDSKGSFVIFENHRVEKKKIRAFILIKGETNGT
jgi:hypothetical protein